MVLHGQLEDELEIVWVMMDLSELEYIQQAVVYTDMREGIPERIVDKYEVYGYVNLVEDAEKVVNGERYEKRVFMKDGMGAEDPAGAVDVSSIHVGEKSREL